MYYTLYLSLYSVLYTELYNVLYIVLYTVLDSLHKRVVRAVYSALACSVFHKYSFQYHIEDEDSMLYMKLS